jgi:hypothetical protein
MAFGSLQLSTPFLFGALLCARVSYEKKIFHHFCFSRTLHVRVLVCLTVCLVYVGVHPLPASQCPRTIETRVARLRDTEDFRAVERSGITGALRKYKKGSPDLGPILSDGTVDFAHLGRPCTFGSSQIIPDLGT